MNKPLLITTGDGSHTLFQPQPGEAFHSQHGALQESLHVFIENGLKHKLQHIQEPISILEIGFGTGLNAWLTAEETISKKCLTHYTTVEAFPIDEELYSLLNYSTLHSFNHGKEIFNALHTCSWEEDVPLDAYFILHKKRGKAEEIIFKRNSCDLIYHDAFSPEKQPELWSPIFLHTLCESLKPAGILVTYCCKGEVKRFFSRAGLKVTKLPGPPGKREMLRVKREC